MTASEKSPAHEAPKPGIHSSESWLTAVAMILPWLVDNLPPTWRVVANVASAGVYTISRAIVKRR